MPTIAGTVRCWMPITVSSAATRPLEPTTASAMAAATIVVERVRRRPGVVVARFRAFSTRARTGCRFGTASIILLPPVSELPNLEPGEGGHLDVLGNARPIMPEWAGRLPPHHRGCRVACRGI